MDSHGMRWLRWAFNCAHWRPTESEWLLANKCIQSEEVARISQFAFQAPAISSLVGRLMLRKGLQTCTGLSNSQIQLSRTSEGRPFVPGLEKLDINVSHHGHWVVLALETDKQVGVDAMSLDRPINMEVDDYLKLMRRQFTADEWLQIDKSSNRLTTFYRFWCLKESYVKAIGVGLNLDLQTISFTVQDELSESDTVDTTVMTVEGRRCGEWLFEERMLDANHCVAVCSSRHKPADKLNKPFTFISTDKILDLDTINDSVSASLWTNFAKNKYSAR